MNSFFGVPKPRLLATALMPHTDTHPQRRDWQGGRPARRGAHAAIACTLMRDVPASRMRETSSSRPRGRPCSRRCSRRSSQQAAQGSHQSPAKKKRKPLRAPRRASKSISRAHAAREPARDRRGRAMVPPVAPAGTRGRHVTPAVSGIAPMRGHAATRAAANARGKTSTRAARRASPSSESYRQGPSSCVCTWCTISAPSATPSATPSSTAWPRSMASLPHSLRSLHIRKLNSPDCRITDAANRSACSWWCI